MNTHYYTGSEEGECLTPAFDQTVLTSPTSNGGIPSIIAVSNITVPVDDNQTQAALASTNSKLDTANATLAQIETNTES